MSSAHETFTEAKLPRRRDETRSGNEEQTRVKLVEKTLATIRASILGEKRRPLIMPAIHALVPVAFPLNLKTGPREPEREKDIYIYIYVKVAVFPATASVQCIHASPSSHFQRMIVRVCAHMYILDKEKKNGQRNI